MVVTQGPSVVIFKEISQTFSSTVISKPSVSVCFMDFLYLPSFSAMTGQCSIVEMSWKVGPLALTVLVEIDGH